MIKILGVDKPENDIVTEHGTISINGNEYDLAPCPFCGSKDIHIDETTNILRCFCCGSWGPNTGVKPEDAVHLWNERCV